VLWNGALILSTVSTSQSFNVTSGNVDFSDGGNMQITIDSSPPAIRSSFLSVSSTSAGQGLMILGSEVSNLVFVDLNSGTDSVQTPVSFNVAWAANGIEGMFYGLPAGSIIACGYHLYQVDYVSDGGNGMYLQLTYIPMPYTENTPMDLWKSACFGSSSANPSVSGDTVVNNGAGITNLMAYALAANPYTASAGNLPTANQIPVSGTRYLQLAFTRNTAATDISYIVQGSSDLSQWSTIRTFRYGRWTPGGNVTDDSGAVTVQDTTPMSSTPGRFLRLQVIKQ
jgi:hypothetical protein